MAGYSATPLLKKLGIKPDDEIIVLNEPESYWNWLSPLPDGVKATTKARPEGVPFIHLFVKEKKSFEKEFVKHKKLLRKDGMLWVSWPKKSSRVPTDLDENSIRDFGLDHGLVDVKVCAVDEVWSGLKFMFRVKDR